MQQYYKNTLPISIAKYKAGAMNTVGLLFDYVTLKFKPESKITLFSKDVCAELGILISTFYCVLKKVQQLLARNISLRHETLIPVGMNQKL